MEEVDRLLRQMARPAEGEEWATGGGRWGATPKLQVNTYLRFMARLVDTTRWASHASSAPGGREAAYLALTTGTQAWYVVGGAAQPYLCGVRDPRQFQLLTQLRLVLAGARLRCRPVAPLPLLLVQCS